MHAALTHEGAGFRPASAASEVVLRGFEVVLRGFEVVLRGLRGRPPRPPRSSADLRYFRCQKIIEGGIFRGFVVNQKLLSDLDLGGPGDLRSDLRGHPRPRFYLKV